MDTRYDQSAVKILKLQSNKTSLRRWIVVLEVYCNYFLTASCTVKTAAVLHRSERGPMPGNNNLGPLYGNL